MAGVILPVMRARGETVPEINLDVRRKCCVAKPVRNGEIISASI